MIVNHIKHFQAFSTRSAIRMIELKLEFYLTLQIGRGEAKFFESIMSTQFTFGIYIFDKFLIKTPSAIQPFNNNAECAVRTKHTSEWNFFGNKIRLLLISVVHTIMLELKTRPALRHTPLDFNSTEMRDFVNDIFEISCAFNGTRTHTHKSSAYTSPNPSEWNLN